MNIVRWVGDGRKPTQTGAITLADARVLVDRPGTGDMLDPAIGDRVFRSGGGQVLDRIPQRPGAEPGRDPVRRHELRRRLVPAAPRRACWPT